MAGDWIKMRVGLQYDIKVTRLARILNGSQSFLNTDLCWNSQIQDGHCNVAALQLLVIGALHRFWCAAQEVSDDGILKGMTYDDVDCLVGITGFASALESVGWVTENSDGNVVIPDWETHNSESAKKRAQANKRVTQHRNKVKRSGVTKALPEKRRVEKSKRRDLKENKQKKPVSVDLSGFDPELQTAIRDWLTYKDEIRDQYKPQGLKQFIGRVAKSVGKHGANAVADAFEQAMANGWHGWEHGLGAKNGQFKTSGQRRTEANQKAYKEFLDDGK